MMSDWPDRLNRFVEALRNGKRPEPGLATTPEELEELRMAALLAGIRPGFDEPDPGFVTGLRERVGVTGSVRGPMVTRGRLLRVAGIWVAGVAGGVGLDRAWQRFQAPPATNSTFTLPRGHWYAVGEFADLVPGVAKPVDAGAVPAFVLRDGDSVLALSRVCTHMGCLLQFSGDKHGLQCPCHGAVFDLDGKPDPEYVKRPLPSLPRLTARVDQGTIYVLGT